MIAVVGAVGLALLLRLALEPILAGTQVWLTFWPAPFLAAWYGGFWAGVATAVGSVVIVGAWVIPGSGVLTVERAVVGGIVFFVANVGIAFVTSVARRGRTEERRLRELAEAARRDEHRQRDRLRALVELAEVLASAEKLDDVSAAVVTEGRRTMGADTTGLYVVDDARGRLRLVAERGGAPDVIEKVREIELASETGRAFTIERWVEGNAQYRTELPDLASLPSAHQRPQAWWSMPLEAAGQMIGVLAMGFFRPHEFPTEEREFVRLFARHCAQAVARAERAARLERERLRLHRIFDSNLIGTLFWEGNGRIARANDTFLKVIGYTRDDLASGRVDWRAFTPPEHSAADRAAVEQVKAVGYHEPYTKEYLHKDGHRVPVLVASAAFFDDPRQGVTFVADLSDVKRAADMANREKDAFLAMLGHELRNPLAPITTALELIEMRGLAGSDRALGIIRRQVEHLTRMVDDLLDVSRIHSGKIQLARQAIELHEILGRAIETVSPLLEERRHRLVIDVPRTGLVVSADLERMSQVVVNVLTNAAKYCDPHGEIRIEARRVDAEIVLTIADNGVGIDPKLLPRVFELFTQEAQTFDRSRGGLGLGLAIARTFVDAHGGSITAHSDGKGTGSTFTIRVPVAAVRSPSSDPAIAAPPSVANAKVRRVLVVDDNRDAAEMLADLAVHRGHEARRANDGPEALRMLQDFVPDVALLDLGLPAMDGYELAQRVRQMPHLRDVRLVAVTGYGQQSDRDRTRAAGFDLHLVKPLQVQDVIRAIEGEPEGVLDPSPSPSPSLSPI